MLAGIFVLFLHAPFAQNISPDRLADWSRAGLSEEIEDPQLFISVTEFGAVGNGISDDTEAVLAAIQSAGEEAATILFPVGTYLITQPVYFHSELCFKGDGSGNTHLKFSLASDNESCLNITSSQNNEFMALSDGYQQNSTTLWVEGEMAIQSGDFVEIQQENGEWDCEPADWAQNSVGQVIEVVSVNGNQLVLKDPLRIDYSETLYPVIRKIIPIRNIIIENLSIERLDEPTDGGGKNIYMAYAVNIQVSGVESRKSQGSHLYATHCAHIFVFGNYFHDAFLFDGTDTRGYGVTLNMHSSNCLIENNIFRNLRHAMMIKTGANGNVFSFNYSREPRRSEPIANYSGDISIHGHYPYANLFEENIVQNLFIDHYWGPGGPYNTFMRNRTELYGIMMTTPNGQETRTQNFIGNEIEGNFPYGFYTLTGTDHFEFGNNDGGTCIPANTQNLTDESYFYEDSPWFLNTEFPTIGYPNNLSQNTIPAKERWISGGLMTMEYHPSSVGFEPLQTAPNKLILLQNPVTDNLQLLIPGNHRSLNYSIYNVQGQVIIAGNMLLDENKTDIPLNSLSSGIYLISVAGLSTGGSLVFVKR